MIRVWILTCMSTLGLVTISLSVTGCDQQSGSGPNEVAATTPTPEESFDLIVATFKRRVESTPGVFVASRASTRSRTMATNEVTSQLLPPAKEGEPYRGAITVLSKTSYSLQRSVDDPDESPDDSETRDNANSSFGLLDESSDADSGTEILQPGLILSPEGQREKRSEPTGPAETVITRRDFEEERTFEFEYKNGRWILLTKPNPETEKAIELAFEEALGTQG